MSKLSTFVRVVSRVSGSWGGLVLLLAARTTFAQTNADCTITFHFTLVNQSSPASGGLNNLNTGCITWNMVVNSTGFTAYTLALQSAPNTILAGTNTPGTWVTFLGGTVLSGANPVVGAGAGAAGNLVQFGYNPWIRVQVTSVTGSGTIDGTAYGYRNPNASSVPASSSGLSNVNVANWGGAITSLGQKIMASSVPVTIASDQSSIPVTPVANSPFNLAQVAGSSSLDPCFGTLKTPFSISQTANARVIVGVASKKTYICNFDVVGSDAENITVVEGTGATCGTNTIAMGGFAAATAANGWNFAANGGIAKGAGVGTIGNTTVVADDVCIFQSGAGRVAGGGTFVQQ